MKRDTHDTLVIFRAENYGKLKGMVTAIMPELDASRGRVQVFDASEGHSEGDFNWWRFKTRPATPEEYAETVKAMEAHGYRLKIRARWNRGRA